jgi:PAS domain S-box-containing protein
MHIFPIQSLVSPVYFQEFEERNNSLLQRALHDATFRTLIERLPAITYVTAMDEFSSTLYASPQVEEMLGFSQAEWMASPTLWLDQIHPEDRPCVLEELARIRAGGMPVACEYRMFTCVQEIVWFHDNAAVLRDEDGQPLVLYHLMLNITERKRLETDLAQMQAQLLAATKERFSERELAVLRLIQEGRTDREISQELAISERTVGYCLQGLYAKFGVKKRITAIREAIRLHLLEDW